ncbi:MAG: Ig-like domain-containing protein [Terracidiphilus sp.]
MRGLTGRSLRLELVAAGLGVALALPALALPAGQSGLATETTLNAALRDQSGLTQATLSISVAGRDGAPVTGAVTIEDAGKPLAGVALDSEGHASSVLSLAPGEHHLTAVYAGDETHATSVSDSAAVVAATGSTPDFTISIAPTTLSLQQGQSGTIAVSITPVNAASLTAPMFVALSCAGLPDQSTCTFTPTNVQVLPNATAAVTSSMVIATVAGSTTELTPLKMRPSNRVTWCLLLPGALGLAGLAFGARRKAWLSRLSMLGLLAMVTVLGTVGCSPLYNYRNHGPPHNLPTPAGSYTLHVTAQSSNGVTAVPHTASMVLTVTE